MTVLLVPREDLPNYSYPAFAPGTPQLLAFLQENLPAPIRAHACVKEHEYRELSLRALVLELGSLVVAAVVLPVIAQLMANYVQKQIDARADHATDKLDVRLELTVQQDDRLTKALRYSGPPRPLLDILGELKRDGASAIRRLEHGQDSTQSRDQ
jgi:hypothetical protein